MLKNYKDTLLMPKTNFDMRANLIVKEPEFRKFWEENNIYKKALEQNKNNTKFILHDGPPYANGSIHVGHALNKILKDVIVRYKTMNGYYAPFAPGWDTHGLPIENKMLQDMNMSKDELDAISLRKAASKYADEQVSIQKKQFKHLQLFSDMEIHYKTKDYNFEVGQLKLFKKMYLDGLVYKGLKPVYWSPSSQSALAEAEVEYQDVRSPQIIVAFNTTSIYNDSSRLNYKIMLPIMTTTPWTLIANSGIAFGKNISYAYVFDDEQKITYIVAKERVNSFKESIKKVDLNVSENIIFGQDVLEEISYYITPITKVKSKLVLSDHVTIETGTGIVHIAPLFGEDDYLVGKDNHLKMIMHVDDKGKLTKTAGKYAGLFYLNANKEIGQDLEKEGLLLAIKFIKHSYPHDWRTHKPVIYRATPQWFVNISIIKKNILDELNKVESYPKWGSGRLSKMILQRDEWTISRQRTWGVPIIAFYDPKGNIVLNEKIFNYVINLVGKYGSNIWWEKEADELLPEIYRGKNFTKEMDIMDVWFDSGSSHIWMESQYKVAQADLYLEGGDQYRGWFNSSLINGVAYRGISPYKKFISHGFVLDGKNQKMSKSKGNVIDPLSIIKKQGADILRLWVANSEYTSDITISNEILQQVSSLYRNFRTKLRFMLGNLNDFNNEINRVERTGFDLLIYQLFNNMKASYFKLMDQYNFSKAIKVLNNFIVELSGFYLDYTKDYLYADKDNSIRRRMVQTNIYDITYFYILALAPFLPTTMEDAYVNFNKTNKKQSVHLEVMDRTIYNVDFNIDAINEFMHIKDLVFKLIEKHKKTGNIKRSFEAHIQIPKFSLDILNLDLSSKLMVGKITFGSEVKLIPWKSYKCERCWNHFDVINEKNLCKRCAV